MKEKFIKRYVSAIHNYFSYQPNGEGKRAWLYVMQEYELILKEEFGMKHEEIRKIYDTQYNEYYFKKGAQI